MIQSFLHSGLKRFFEHGDSYGINITDTERLYLQLELLDRIDDPQLLNMPGWNLRLLAHPNTWSVDADRLYSLVFKMSNKDVYSLNLKPSFEVVINNDKNNKT